MLNIGLATEIITPAFGAGLAGYFNYRPARGVYDDIKVRAMAVEKDGKRTGFIVFDLCYLLNPFINELRIELRGEGIDFADDIVISATHTHTGTSLWLAHPNEAESAARTGRARRARGGSGGSRRGRSGRRRPSVGGAAPCGSTARESTTPVPGGQTRKRKTQNSRLTWTGADGSIPARSVRGARQYSSVGRAAHS